MAIHSPEFQKKKRKRAKILLYVSVILLVAVSGVIVYVSRLPKLLIKNIEVSGNSVTNSGEIKEIIEKSMGGRYLWLIPKANAFLLPRSTIEGELKYAIPRLKSVEMRVSSPETLSVEVSERSPHALYCEDVSVLYSPDKCFFLDEDGFIFSKAPSFFGDVYFVYSLAEPVSEPLGQNLLGTEEFASIELLRRNLSSISVEAKMFEADSGEYRLILPAGGKIMWPSEDKAEVVYSNLQAFLEDSSVKENPSFLSQVLYIDMRFNNKIFYKLKDERE